MTTKLAEHTSLAEAAGFTNAAKVAHEEADVISRLARAYEHYRYVSNEKITAFKNRLRASTLNYNDPYRLTYDTLKFESAESYKSMPPANVLEAVKAAKATGIFDTFEVASIETVRVVVDPIVFGCIEGCTDKFFIAQWGEDVKISDLLGENEG